MPIKYKSFIYIFIFSLAVLCLSSFSFAQEFSASAIAEYQKIDEKVENGDLISLHASKNLKSTRRYDPNFIGVISTQAGVYLGSNLANTEGYYPVVSSGKIKIKVSTLNGVIKNGDRLTTSEIPGIAIKLNEGEDPNPIGIALEDYNESDPKKIRLIEVLLMKRGIYTDTADPYKENILTAFFDRFALNKQRYESPSQLLRFFFSAVIILSSLIFAFVTFRKVAVNGITSLGRNPLAGKAIFLHLALNILFILAIVLIGVVLGYFIVNL